MLVNFINPDKLPFFILWLDWCFYAYKKELGIIILIAIIAWLIVCFVKQGPALG